ncbi:hypothetical protein BC567DRAFT_299680 [Phyllosticta citribraziliensis]
MAIPAGEYAGHMSEKAIPAGEYGHSRWRVCRSRERKPYPPASMAIPAGEYAGHMSEKAIPTGEYGHSRWRVCRSRERKPYPPASMAIPAGEYAVGLPVSAVTSPPVVISTRGIPLSSHRFAPPEIGRPATTSSPNDLIADPKLTMEPPESNISAAAAAAAAALEATSHADMLQQLRTRQTQRLARELAQ